jgi:glycosyltransferase involved in cell wall biosynthesis
MTTYNKLSFLKITLPYLIDACKEDEEIVIVDGGSNDGTVDYLKELYQQKKIHQFISEKDFGEAHGTNKAILMAKGELLKIITDDDVFDFDVINLCKKQMSSDESIDVIGTEGIAVTVGSEHHTKTQYALKIVKWKNHKENCWFSGLSLMIRKSSIPFLGLFHTGFKMIDFEYIARLSLIRPNLSFFSGYSYTTIVNPSSNSFKMYNLLLSEQKKINEFYLSKGKINKNILKHRIYNALNNTLIYLKIKPVTRSTIKFNYYETYITALYHLKESNLIKEFKFY